MKRDGAVLLRYGAAAVLLVAAQLAGFWFHSAGIYQGTSNVPLADFPEVRRSVVNYGVPSFSGRSSRDFDRDVLGREIRAVLATFEPRLKESATTVTVTLGDKTVGLKIEIDAVLIMTPTPERMRLRTTINLDNGLARTEIRDA